MKNNRWTLADENGNPPTAEQLEQFVNWVSHDDSRPIVRASRSEKTCILDFYETDRRTFASAAVSADRAIAMEQEIRSVLEMIKTAAAAEDWETISRLCGV